MIIATVLLIVYLFNYQTAFLVIPCILMINTLYNLNPLIKYDGYWVLSDATKTPNLHENAYKKVKQFGLRIFKKEKNLFSYKDYFLVVYGIISLSFIFILLIIILIINPNSVLKLPLNILDYINSLESFNLTDLNQFIMPLIFWYLSFKLMFSFLKKNFLGKTECQVLATDPNCQRPTNTKIRQVAVKEF